MIVLDFVAFITEITIRIPGYLPVLQISYDRLKFLAEKEFPA